MTGPVLQRLGAVALLLAAIVAPAGASEIFPGFDLFESQPGTTADLSSLGAGCPAAVPLEGVPLVPSSLGNTDTIVQRLDGSGSPFDPPGDMVTVEIELVALHLVSVAPVDLSCAAGPPAVDLHLTINKAGVIAGLPQPDVLAPSLGGMEIFHDLGPGAMDDFGGGFDSCFGALAEPGHPACATLGVVGGGVFANAIFTVPGGDPSDPADVVSSTAADRIVLSSTGGAWLHVPAPGYPLDPGFPAGAFFVQTLPHIGPHPVEPAKVVEATKVDSLTSVGGVSGDVDADGVADPGDTVSYTVEITGLGDAADVTLEDTIDANSTLVGGSVQITPIAFDDFYELTGTMLTVPAGTGVLVNDVDPDHSTMPGTNAGLTAVSLNVIGTAGTVSNFLPDGSFEYEPAMGFSGLDSFQYTARDEDSLDSVSTGVVVVDVKNSPPTATDDSYDSLGNTLLEITLDHAGVASADNTVVTQPSVIGDASPAKTYRSVFENDTDAEDTDKNDLTAAVVGATVTAGAIVTMFDDGTFEYTPPVGFTGADTFDYTVTDTGGLMDTGTVTINVGSVIWFVDKDNAGTADGRSATPFTSLAPLDGAGGAGDPDAAGQTIFVFDETAGSTADGIELENNQILHGNGVALDPAGFLYGGGGDLVAAGTAPILGSTGDVVNLASGNTVRGLDVAATAGRAIFGNASAGATITDVSTTGTGSGTGVRFDNATGTIAISDLDVASSTDSGIDIQGGSATFTFDSLSSITNTGAPAFNVNGGTAQVTYSGSITQGNNFPAVSITGHSNGAGIGITFDTGAVSATNGTGLQFSNANGTYNFNGTTTLSLGDAGIDILSGSAGTFTFANTAITNPTGVGLNIDGSTAAVTFSGGAGISKNNGGAILNVNNHSTGSINIGVNLNASAGTGLQFSNADGTYNFNTMTATTTLNGGDAGIDILGGSAGTFTFGPNVSITSPTGIAFNAALSSANVTYSGSITHNTAGVTGIRLNANTGTVTFRGGLVLNTGSATAFHATGGGTVNVCVDDNCSAVGGAAVVNTIGATTALTKTAINITGATIGADGVAFRSISVNQGATGSDTTAIILDNTGSGPFRITGTGASGTGGTIENLTDVDAITLNNVGGLVTLEDMIIEDIGDSGDGSDPFDTRSERDAIHGRNVNGGLTLDNTIIRRISDNAILGSGNDAGTSNTNWNGLQILNSTIEDTNRFHIDAPSGPASNGVADAQDEGSVRILGLTGTVLVDNSTFQDGGELLDFFVVSGDTVTMTVTNSTFNRAYKEFSAGSVSSRGKMCIDVSFQGTGAGSVTVGDQTANATGNGAGDAGNSFLNCRLASVRAGNDVGATGAWNAIIGNNTFTVDDHSSGSGGDFDFPHGGVKIISRGEDSAAINSIITRNIFDEVTNADGADGQVGLDLEDGQFQIRVDNNLFDTPGNAAWFLRADSSQSAAVLFQSNSYAQGSFTCPDPSCGGGYTAPGLHNGATVQNGGNLDLTVNGDVFAAHDVGFDPNNTFELRIVNVGGGGTACANLINNQSPHGYRLREDAGTLSMVGAAVSTCAPEVSGTPTDNDADPATCRTELQTKGNRGGAGDATANPPDVDVLGNTIDVVTGACTQPSGGIFSP